MQNANRARTVTKSATSGSTRAKAKDSRSVGGRTKNSRDLNAAVREACLWMPETEEYLSHGSPNFRVRGKTFATYALNHHGDGRIALWLNAPAGAQSLYVKTEPKHFFIPPYVGPRGWLGVNLDKGIAWTRVAQLVREAYEKVAPPKLSVTLGKTPAIQPPSKELKTDQIDPLQSKHARSIVNALRKICLALPEVVEATQFGTPVWKAGKKSFACAYAYTGRPTLSFWVGADQQALLTSDPRYSVPPYLGHAGWIALDAGVACDWSEVRSLAIHSYRHFALKRMLAALER